MTKKGKIEPINPPQKYSGRPVEYDSSYCERLIDHMEQGLSFESFAGILGCCKQSLYNWAERFPEFLDAKNIGTEKSRLFYELAGLNGMMNHIPFFNDRVWRLNMMNRFPNEWKEKVENLHKIEQGAIVDWGDGKTDNPTVQKAD
jgi:hypothetical protein